MKRIILISLNIFITLNIFSQNKTVEINLGEDRVLSGVYNSKNGIQFIKTTNKSKYGKKQKAKLMRFEEDLKKSFEIDIKGRNKMGATFVRATTFFETEEVSNYGNYFLNDDQLIDKDGKIHHFEVDYRKQDHVNPIFSFFSDYGWSFIGPRKGRKYYKKKYTNDDINIYTIKNLDSKTILEKLKTPKINHNKKVATWHLGDNYPDKFFMISKNKPNEEMNIDTYHMVSYNYSGKALAYVPLTIKLESNNHLSKSSNGGPTDFESNFGKFSFGNVFYDKNESTFYVYGMFSDKAKKEKSVKAKIKGFYLHKFDANGKLLWRYNYTFNKLENRYITELSMSFQKLNNDSCIITGDFGFEKSSSDVGGFYLIDTKKGTLIKNENPFGNYEYKKMKNSTNLKNMEKNIIGAQYQLNSNSKIKISYNVFSSLVINPKIEKYIKSKNKELYFDASITENNIILKEFNQKERVLKLMLFNN